MHEVGVQSNLARRKLWSMLTLRNVPLIEAQRTWQRMSASECPADVVVVPLVARVAPMHSQRGGGGCQ